MIQQNCSKKYWIISLQMNLAKWLIQQCLKITINVEWLSFMEELFKKRINKQYECSFGDYIFIYPKSTQDIKDEAASQNNCVASYIDKVIDGKCHILFLRKKNKPDESLVTIEVRNNHIVQARRRFNDDVTAEDQRAIDAFNKKFANKEDKAA